jgi:endoglucanase
MKKYIFIIFAFIAMCGAFSSCGDIADNFDKYLQLGESVHVGKLDSLYLYSGKNRAQLKCWISDARATKLGVKRPNSDTYQWFNLTDSNREDSIVVMIDSLEEGSNELELVTSNADGTVMSIPTYQSVTVFGDKYQAILQQRPLQSATSVGDMVTSIWGARSTAQLIGEEITYTKADGNIATIFAPASDDFTKLIGSELKGSFTYRTLFIPTETAVDTFYTEPTTISFEPYDLGNRPAGMKSIATELARKIFMGWNLGNSMEVGSGETAWGNPMTTQAIIDAVKAAGYNAVRIPCKWENFVESSSGTNYRIKADRMARVKEIVDYCINDGMYVILNTHHDWIEGACAANTTDTQAQVALDKIDKIWGQIAEEFKNYDEHLLFACTNEPNGSAGRPWTLLKQYEQRFVDVVRASGGNNAYRVLVIQGPSTNIAATAKYMSFPTDPTPYSQMVEVHDYTPAYFCMYKGSLFLWGEPFVQYGHEDARYQESYVLAELEKMKAFAGKNIPIVMGEFGCLLNRTLTDPTDIEHHAQSRAYWMKYMTEQAKNMGYIPFVWDDGYNFPIMDRKNAKVFTDRQIDVDAMNEGAKAGHYPF